MAKRARYSKTLWFNAAGAALLALEANLHLLQPYVAGNAYAWVATGLAVGNAALRFFTTQSIRGAK